MRSFDRWIVVLMLALISCDPSNETGDSKPNGEPSSSGASFVGSYVLSFDEIARRHGKIEVEELETDEGKHRLEDARDMLVKMAGELTLKSDGTFSFNLELDGVAEVTEGTWTSVEDGFSMTSEMDGQSFTSKVLPEDDWWVLRNGPTLLVFAKKS